jgi:NAD(P)-dependent dehydrogenase (short-subunit alcohol dehydrogenase family)
MSPAIYLVSGANRGIGQSSVHRVCIYVDAAISGFGLVKALATRSDTVVFAGARSPSSAAQLQELARQQKNVHVLKLTSCDKTDNQAAAAEIKKVAGALHVVIANAGQCVLSDVEQSKQR